MMQTVTLQVPEQYRPGIVWIATSSDSAISEMAQVLSEAQPALGETGLVEYAIHRLPDHPPDEVRAVMEAVLSLSYSRPLLSMTIPVLAEHVANSPDVDVPDDDRLRLEERLIALMGQRPVVVTAKSAGVLVEHANVFESARVMTDIRPIFLDRPTDDPGGAVICHSLRLSYRAGQRSKQMYVALDENDIRQLVAVLERAEGKAETLKRIWEGTKIPLLHTDGSPE